MEITKVYGNFCAFQQSNAQSKNHSGKKNHCYSSLSCLNFNVVICNLQRASCFVNISVGLIQNDNTNSQLHILVYRCVGLIAKYVANLREICWLLSSQDFWLVAIFFFQPNYTSASARKFYLKKSRVQRWSFKILFIAYLYLFKWINLVCLKIRTNAVLKERCL